MIYNELLGTLNISVNGHIDQFLWVDMIEQSTICWVSQTVNSSVITNYVIISYYFCAPMKLRYITLSSYLVGTGKLLGSYLVGTG